MAKQESKGNGLPSSTRLRVEEALSSAAAEGRPPRVLFVCLGNICRSPAAQGVAEAIAAAKGLDDIEFDSAGFYGGHAGDLPDPRMRSAAFQRGYRLDHRSRVFRRSDFDRFDIIIGMDGRNMADLLDATETFEDELKLFRMTDFTLGHPEAKYVPDPYYEGAAGFQLVLDLLEDGCSVLVDELSRHK